MSAAIGTILLIYIIVLIAIVLNNNFRLNK